MKIWDRLVWLASTSLGVGTVPLAPGTFGSLVGFILAWYFNPSCIWWFMGLTVLGFVVSSSAQKIFKSPDPQDFVLDEVCGMLLAVLWLPQTLGIFVVAFVLFRIFDIFKPWPASYFNRMTRWPGMMLDDLVAGAYVNILLQMAIYVINNW